MNENLLGFLVAVSLYWYLEKRRLPSLVAFACALLSKESAVMLPFVLMVLETRRHDLKRALPVLSPYLIILAVYLFVRTIVVGFPGSPALNPNRLEQALVACSAVADYVRLLLVPYPLNVFYPAKRFASPLQPELLMSVAVCILIGYAVWKWRSHRELSPLLAGVLLMLAPVLANANRLALGIERGYIAERQLYVPTIFFSLLLAGIMTTYASRAVTRVLAVTLLCLVPVFVAVTIAATGVWANDDVFMARFTRDFPNLSLSHLYKGQILFKSGNLDGAMQESTAALSALPSETLHVLQDPTRKAVLAESQDPDTSRHKETKQSRLLLHYLDFDGLAAYSPEFASVHFLMGLICRDKNDLDCAINKFKVTLALQPHYVGGRAHLAESYLRKGMIQDARREYPRALRDLSRIKGVTYRDTELQRLLCQ